MAPALGVVSGKVQLLGGSVVERIICMYIYISCGLGVPQEGWGVLDYLTQLSAPETNGLMDSKSSFKVCKRSKKPGRSENDHFPSLNDLHGV